MVVSGRKGDGLAMVDANRACTVWGTKQPFEPNEVQKALLPLAQSGDPKAMFSMGISMIRFATPGPGDAEQRGKDWVRRAAESGYAPAMLHMVSQIPHHAREEKNRWIKKAYETLLPKAEAGDVDAMLELVHVPPLLGDSKKLGVALISNEEKNAWLRKAMALGSTEAMIKLSDWLRRDSGHSREATLADRQESMELSMKLVEMGHWSTMADLGAIYAIGCWPNSSWEPTDLGPDGQKLREDPAKAWEWWDKAIAIAGKEAVLKYLLERHNVGDSKRADCFQIPPRPQKP
jgi:TPR repeat protein